MNFSLSQIIRKFVRISIVMVATVFLMLGSTHPALAFGNSNSNPSQGTAQMNQLQKESKRAVRSEPRSRQQVQQRAQRGPNEVQGDADLQGMNVPSNSKKATTVRQQAEDVLKKVTPGN